MSDNANFFTSLVSSSVGLAAFAASKFPILSMALNEAMTAQREEAERRAFEAVTGIAWEDRRTYKPVLYPPDVTVVDVRAEIERRLRGDRED